MSTEPPQDCPPDLLAKARSFEDWIRPLAVEVVPHAPPRPIAYAALAEIQAARERIMLAFGVCGSGDAYSQNLLKEATDGGSDGVDQPLDSPP